MTKLFSATGDGACLFNALALGFSIELLSGRLDGRLEDENYQKLLEQFAAQHPNFSPKTWANVKSWLQYYNNARDIELILAPVLFNLNKNFASEPQDILLQELSSLLYYNKTSIQSGLAWYEIMAQPAQGICFPTLDMLSLATKAVILERLGQLIREAQVDEFQNCKALINKEASLLDLLTNEYKKIDTFQRGYSCGDISKMAEQLHLEIHENEMPNPKNASSGIYLKNKEAHWDLYTTEEDGFLIDQQERKLLFSSADAFYNRETVAAPPGNATEPPQVIIVNKLINNPGLGNCAFYAFATGLINIIQEEHSSHNRELFNRLTQLQPSIRPLYQQICDFHIEEAARTSQDKQLLESLQKALRRMLFQTQLNELKQDCVNPGEDNTRLKSNSIFSNFAAVYFENIREIKDYNEFARSKSILKEIDQLKAEHSKIKDIPFTQIILDLQTLFLRLLYGKDTPAISLETPFLRNSSIVLAMEEITRDYVWGTYTHLDALARTLSVNLHYLINGSASQPFHDLPNQHCITIDNQNNMHWVTHVTIAFDRLKEKTSKPATTPSSPPATTPARASFFDIHYSREKDEMRSEEPVEPAMANPVNIGDPLDRLIRRVEQANKEYQTYNKSLWFSLRHRHAATGRRNANQFVANLKKETRYQDAIALLIDYMEHRRLDNGNTHPHSFRTMLLQNVLGDEPRIPLTLVSSQFKSFLQQFKECQQLESFFATDPAKKI